MSHLDDSDNCRCRALCHFVVATRRSAAKAATAAALVVVVMQLLLQPVESHYGTDIVNDWHGRIIIAWRRQLDANVAQTACHCSCLGGHCELFPFFFPPPHTVHMYNM